MSDRQSLGKAKRWIIKIGSALLTGDGKGLDISAIQNWAGQMAGLRSLGVEVVLVSSGAIAAGRQCLALNSQHLTIHQKQAAAAVGQMGLVQTYEQAFQKHQLQTAQILLDHDDLSNRTRYLNARSTLLTLLEMGVIPVVNENDTVVTDEIRFGDNDTLGALVANLLEADVLVLLTDQLGMYDCDPRHNPEAKLIRYVAASDSSLDSKASGGGSLGRGGMITKVRAARIAARSGANTLIVGGRIDKVLTRLRSGEDLGTFLYASHEPQAARKRWLAGNFQVRGTLVLDEGAVKALTQGGKSLLPIGVRSLKGRFSRGEMVNCVDRDGREIARGLVNYHSDEAAKIIGHGSESIEGLLGYLDDEELIHRDNLILV